MTIVVAMCEAIVMAMALAIAVAMTFAMAVLSSVALSWGCGFPRLDKGGLPTEKYSPSPYLVRLQSQANVAKKSLPKSIKTSMPFKIDF